MEWRLFLSREGFAIVVRAGSVGFFVEFIEALEIILGEARVSATC